MGNLLLSVLLHVTSTWKLFLNGLSGGNPGSIVQWLGQSGSGCGQFDKFVTANDCSVDVSGSV